MSIHLPHPIEIYVQLENSVDDGALEECFAPNAVVRDETRTYEGLASIKQWKTETKRKYNHTLTPLAVAQRDGKTILTARLAGTFPGSPVTLQFCFALEHGKIATLEIQA